MSRPWISSFASTIERLISRLWMSLESSASFSSQVFEKRFRKRVV